MSDQAIAKVNHWVDACVRTHSKCVPRKGPLPTRILDVGDEGSDTVKLVISNGREGQYIALCMYKRSTYIIAKISAD